VSESAFDVIALLVAAVLFLLAGINVTHPRLNLIALGLLAWVLVPLVSAVNAR